MNTKLALSILATVSLCGCVATVKIDDDFTPTRAESAAEINTLIDNWHIAASKGDLDAYFGVMGRDAVFLGTDDCERWPRDEFRTFAAPHFADGDGWTFVPHDRILAFSANERVVWFDEKLDSAHMGKCRGTGVLEYRDDAWKIVHYNLTFTIPNDLVPDITARIDEYEATKAQDEPDNQPRDEPDHGHNKD